jgi:hypothetical protein
MRVETVHGRNLLCGCTLPDWMIQNGQTWASADGSNRTVTIESAGSWVDYSWIENGQKKLHTKMSFAFQCRYCLVLPAGGEELTVGNQGTTIAPQSIEVRISWVGPNSVHYYVKGDPKMRETSLDRFLAILYPKKGST